VVNDGGDLAGVYQGLIAVMDRPAQPFQEEPSNCACADCTTHRVERFSCENCGYRGAPFIHACKCTRSSIRGMIEYYEDRLDRMSDRRADDLIGDFASRARIEHTLLQLRESARLVRGGRPCIIRPVAAASTERTGQSDDCLHGLLECPCCGGGPSRYDAESIDPWQRIREMRAVIECLSSGGNACFTMRVVG
jgi:hypothetical protein